MMTRLQLCGLVLCGSKNNFLDQVSIFTSRRNFLSLQVLCRIRGFRDLVQTICIYYITHGLLQIQSLSYYSSFYSGLLDDQIDFNSIFNHTKYSPINYSFLALSHLQPHRINFDLSNIFIAFPPAKYIIVFALVAATHSTIPMYSKSYNTVTVTAITSCLRRDRIEENV